MVPTQIKSSSPLTAVVHMMRLEDPVLGDDLERHQRTVMVTMKLMRGDNSVESETRDIVVGHSEEISVNVPQHLSISTHHQYSLRLVGEDLLRVDGVLFQHNVPLTIWRPEHIINIDCNNKIFRPGQTVQARVTVDQTDQNTYQGPAHVSLINPNGHLVYHKMLQIRAAVSTPRFQSEVHQRMFARLVSSGNVFRYKLDDHTVTGQWTMLVNTELQQSNLSFHVVDPGARGVDVLVELPPAISPTDSTLTGSITANFTHSSLPVCGNLTISASVLSGRNEILFSQVKTQFYHSLQNKIILIQKPATH